MGNKNEPNRTLKSEFHSDTQNSNSDTRRPGYTSISREQLIEKLRTYEVLAPSNQDRFNILRIKKKYLDQEKDNVNKRVKSDIHLAQGYRANLPHSSYSKILEDRTYKDQKDRIDVLEEAKEQYKGCSEINRSFSDKSRNKNNSNRE